MINVKLDAELAYAAWQAKEERDWQRNVVMARNYYAGEHNVKLSERQQEYLGHQLDKARFAVNYCATIVKAVYERLIVKGFECENETYSKWAWDAWQLNRMDQHAVTVHRGAIRDGEHFVFVDWDAVEKRAVYMPHQRYTDASEAVGGDGYGCKAFYPDDDVSRPMERASKRWTEKIVKANGERETRRRMTIYYPDRVEKWIAGTRGTEATWVPYEEDGEPWPIPWTEGDVTPGYYDEDSQWHANPAAKPLGIPLIHFYNSDRRTELWDAVPPQDMVNKTAIDIIATADAAGFPIRLAQGWTPTTDGKPPDPDGSNYLQVFPGCWIGTPTDTSTEIMDAADVAGLLDALDSWIMKLAQVTDTPMSRFQITRQIAAEDTQKQQEAVLLAKVRNRQVMFGNGWEDCSRMAAIITRKMGGDAPEPTALETLWAEAETRDEKAFREGLMMERQMGVPEEILWEKLGYDADTIARMKTMKAEEMEQASNIGGELLRGFESGGFGRE